MSLKRRLEKLEAALGKDDGPKISQEQIEQIETVLRGLMSREYVPPEMPETAEQATESESQQ